MLAEGVIAPNTDSDSDSAAAASTLGSRASSVGISANARTTDFVLHVTGIGLPPADSIDDSRRHFRNFNWLLPDASQLRRRAALLDREDGESVERDGGADGADATAVDAASGPEGTPVLTEAIVDSLLRFERQQESAMIVIVSDIWLDSDRVLLKFRALLKGIGSFCFI